MGDFYLEFFGLVGVLEYEEKMKHKRKLAERVHINLIEIYSDDLFDLDKKLSILKVEF